ncbi:hypothetical protein BDW62DRAFT_47168 [Aspergillus aurantiobrunneus]
MGFWWALRHACLAHEPKDATEEDVRAWKAKLDKSPVRVHVGSGAGFVGEAVERYLVEWTVGIKDVTGLMQDVKMIVDEGDLEGARPLLPLGEVSGTEGEMAG